MCGVFGIRAPDRDVARVAFFGLFALQHRGQESAGIGAELDLPDDALTLFGEGGGRAILASSEELPFPSIGSVGGSTLLGVPIDHLRRAWEEGVIT